MATAHKAPTTQVGANIENVTIQNIAAPVAEHQARALEALAHAATANAQAIGRIADALKGAEAKMEYGIHLSDIRAV